MPRYFFDVHDGIDVRDKAGRVLPNFEAAQVAALELAGRYAIDPKAMGEGSGELVVTVRNAANATLMTARLALNLSLH